ncbi:2-dehydro-3-deoxygalactonokinase [Ruania halotolerans]|uniref:2-dehydro-3-deoxygalactonokinase n=1 Tax=Ruania halotolerans TaxID=2897773 RepID=UPI001E62821A|nr:2-dehydro-3-deoxygalactonokinase [Ruania halotolerans]UFU06740.1 2-dehydro-3-deoxygalactonokinase [Ruania halotolerans]
MDPALITVDWGTTSVRLTAVAADGTELASTAAAEGILTVGTEPAAYAETLARLAGSWAQARPAVIACGMVGSAKGWQEVPYLPAPVHLMAGAPLTEVAGPWGPVHLVPGVSTDGGVMRGEETQLLGLALAGHASGPAILPGTHTKWALVEDGTLRDFHTAMTGELFALLTTHGTIAQVAGPAPEGDLDEIGWAHFEAGVARGLAGAGLGTAALVFGVRARALLESLPPAQVREELSGILIGAEIAGGCHWLGHTPDRLSIVASASLAQRYRRALATAGIGANPGENDVTTRGLIHLARNAGLLTSGVTP